MKTQDKKLDFIKNSLVELDSLELQDINGGTLSPSTGCICAIVVEKFRTG